MRCARAREILSLFNEKQKNLQNFFILHSGHKPKPATGTAKSVRFQSLTQATGKIRIIFSMKTFIREHDILIKLNGKKSSTACSPCEIRLNIEKERERE
jgi:hypothetical protein